MPTIAENGDNQRAKVGLFLAVIAPSSHSSRRSSLVEQKKQPRKRGKAAAAALATTECRVVDVWCRGLLLLRSARARKDNLIHSIVTNVVSRISEVSFESTLHNLLIPNFQLKSQGYLNN